MKKLVQSFFILLTLSLGAFAQERTISGTVTSSEDGLPIPGVSVKIKDTQIGVSTNANGKYSLNVPSSAKTIVFSSIGFTTKELAIGSSNVINAALTSDAKILGEVVVTALGQVKKASNLTYAQQGIKGEDLTSTRLTDVNTALAGKISNVQVRTQSAAKLGSQSSVRIRGANSAANIGNDPLYVVNGTPLDDINFINMDDVEDLQVLKGPAGTALYGQRGANGVILITTKKATINSTSVNFTSTFSADNVGKLPSYQNEYSGGTPGSGFQTYTWAAGDPIEWQALSGKKYHTYYDDASWGPKMDGSEYIPWYAWYPGTEYSFKTASLTPQPNNIRDFYSTGLTYLNNLSFSKATDMFSARVSYTNQDQTGLIPESSLKRNFISAQISYNATKNLKLMADVNFVNQKINGEFSDTYGNNASGSFNSWFHRDLDINILKQLKDFRTPTGKIPAWNLNDVTGISQTDLYGGSAYWTNPYTYYEAISAINKQDRLYGYFGASYDIGSHFKISAYARRNQRNTHYESKLPAIFGESTLDMQSPLANNASGGTRPVTATYRTYDVRQIESNYEFQSAYNQKFGSFGVNAFLGGNIRRNDYSDLDNRTKGGLVVKDLYALNNSLITPFTFSNNISEKIVRSLYGNASVNWNDIVILDFSIRNDWSSALPADNNSYLYPSAGASFVFTKYLKNSLPFISFGKLRGSWASVGSDLDPYQLQLLYGVGTNQFNGNITMTTPNQAIDPNIKPQLSKSFEVGLDLRFLNDRIGFSGTYYNENVTNSIISVSTTGASGFSSKLINAGKLNRNGIELALNATPVKTSNFSYDVILNFARNKSKVEELYPGLDNYYLGGSDYSVASGSAGYAPGVWSVVGGEWGQIRGRGIKKINGQNVINPTTGLFVFEDNVNFGSVLPQFTGGFVNNFNYKGITLSFAIDFAKGGKYFSLSDHWGSFSGLYEYTAGLNDRGKPVRDAVADGGGVHVVGVSSTGAPVDMYVDAVDYYQGNGTNRINETHIFDLSYVKLREVNLGYNIPVNKLGGINKYVKNLQLSVFSRNPWLIYAANRNFDPSELTGNYGESGQLPPSRTFGVTLKVGL